MLPPQAAEDDVTALMAEVVTTGICSFSLLQPVDSKTTKEAAKRHKTMKLIFVFMNDWFLIIAID